MATLRPDTLATSLARIFEGRMVDRASWFALTGGEPLFTEGDPARHPVCWSAPADWACFEWRRMRQHMLGVVKAGEPV